MNNVLQSIHNFYTFGRAVTGTLLSTFFALIGSAEPITQAPSFHWAQVASWIAAGLAGLGTFVGVLVTAYIKLQDLKDRRADRKRV